MLCMVVVLVSGDSEERGFLDGDKDWSAYSRLQKIVYSLKPTNSQHRTPPKFVRGVMLTI